MLVPLNAQDFGDTTESSRGGLLHQAPEDYQQVVFHLHHTIDFITIASTGNTADFGDLTAARRSFVVVQFHSWCIYWRYSVSNSNSNIIDYVTIASTGNAVDFGDLVNTSDNGHGMDLLQEDWF